jgi:hypothetical protein
MAWVAYNGLDREYIHQVIDHAETYVQGNVHTNSIENFWSLLKRGLKGTYVSVEPFHLFRYLDKQAFRFNERKHNDCERFVSAMQGITGKRVTYEKLTGKQEATPVKATTETGKTRTQIAGFFFFNRFARHRASSISISFFGTATKRLRVLAKFANSPLSGSFNARFFKSILSPLRFVGARGNSEEPYKKVAASGSSNIAVAHTVHRQRPINHHAICLRHYLAYLSTSHCAVA